MSSLDYCRDCGERVRDFDPDGFEDGDTGQRGHRVHRVPVDPAASLASERDAAIPEPRPDWLREEEEA